MATPYSRSFHGGRLSCAAALCLVVTASARAQQIEVFQSELAGMPQLSTSLRLGGGFFTDSDASDAYDGLASSGFDVKFHFGNLPLAAQTGMDFGYGDTNRSDLADAGILADDGDLFLFNWRFSVLLEPPPSYLGDRHFYVQPYVGGGIGVHYAEEEVEVDGPFPFTFIEEDRSETGFGWHAMAGIDFVFHSSLSVGLDVTYTDADMKTPITDLELGALTISAALKFHF